MADYFNTGMQLYLDHLVDWKELLETRSGGPVDVEAEVGAFRTILETAGALAASFEPEARKNWAAEAEATPDDGAQSPPHIRRAYDQLREAGLISLTVGEQYGCYGLPALLNGIFLEMISRADASLMMVVGLQTGAASDIEKYGSEEVKEAFLPRFTSGEVEGSMDLTEPEAGSDLGGIASHRSAGRPGPGRRPEDLHLERRRRSPPGARAGRRQFRSVARNHPGAFARAGAAPPRGRVQQRSKGDSSREKDGDPRLRDLRGRL